MYRLLRQVGVSLKCLKFAPVPTEMPCADVGARAERAGLHPLAREHAEGARFDPLSLQGNGNSLAHCRQLAEQNNARITMDTSSRNLVQASTLVQSVLTGALQVCKQKSKPIPITGRVDP